MADIVTHVLNLKLNIRLNARVSLTEFKGKFYIHPLDFWRPSRLYVLDFDKETNRHIKFFGAFNQYQVFNHEFYQTHSLRLNLANEIKLNIKEINVDITQPDFYIFYKDHDVWKLVTPYVKNNNQWVKPKEISYRSYFDWHKVKKPAPAPQP